jgi:two-component system NarL family response regulator
VRLARQLKPDVILMDIRMPLMNGLEAILLIRQENPAARIIILSMYPQDQRERDASGAGANAYLPKVVDMHQLVETVRAVYGGETVPNPYRESKV